VIVAFLFSLKLETCQNRIARASHEITGQIFA